MKSLRFWIPLLVTLPLPAARADEAPAETVRAAVTFYASFDEAVRGDFGGGSLEPQTRFNHVTQAGQFTFEPSIDSSVFRIAAYRGISGGALEPVDVLPNNGRIFFPLRGNLAFNPKGWGGAASVWCNTDPNLLLKTTFCDPIQLTQRGANNGGIWFDFNNARPRDLRYGAFPAVPEGQKPIAEEDPEAPLVRVPQVDWQAGRWHHVVLTWRNFDTGRADAVSSLYIDGRRIGQIRERAIAMDWDVERAGIYTAVNYLGLLDELALFGRELTPDEVRLLHAEPALLTPLKERGRLKQ
jgi:hypothetical protein